ncbi:hypothetical protein FQN54_007084 [Arachnomyces sp. PD_36]|nr:hypothetical protein FQN54_007084 [Arachnomyces sp. PD_36]
MAPVRPKTARAKASKASTQKPKASTTVTGHFEDQFRTNKRDKREIKHSTFLSKIEKGNKKTLKRRRPSKKLVANLDSLADALPQAENAEQDGGNSQVNIIKHKSLKHRPGAMKRKDKLDKVERERFGKNMAQMAGAQPPAVQNTSVPRADDTAASSGRWAALRSFISQTMDQNPEFKAGK